MQCHIVGNPIARFFVSVEMQGRARPPGPRAAALSRSCCSAALAVRVHPSKAVKQVDTVKLKTRDSRHFIQVPGFQIP